MGFFKHFRHSLAILGMLFSLNAFAEQCSLTVQEFTPRTNCRESVKKYAPVEVEDWQGCFIKAVNLAYTIGYQAEGGSELRDRSQCKSSRDQSAPLRLVEWKFNDSFFPLMDSKGRVNSQSLEYLFKPETGNQVFDEGGGRLF